LKRERSNAKLRDDPKGLSVSFETTEFLCPLIKLFFRQMSERRVAQVVG
jgi:hypothetical protein